jgi:Rrf2 family protein
MEIGRNYGKIPTKRKDICKRQDISNSYLENILIALKSAGIINTKRGVNGGYLLARPPSHITLLDVARVLGCSQAPAECLNNSRMCRRSGRCATQDVWRDVREAEERILKKTTIKQLVDKDGKHSRK